MVQDQAASAGIRPNPPRPMENLVKAINDVMKAAEATVDAYDARNDQPIGERHTGDPVESLRSHEIQMAELLEEGSPWIGNAAVEAESPRVHRIRNDDGTETEIATVAVRQLDKTNHLYRSEQCRRIPAELAALLNWQHTIQTLGDGLAEADQEGEWLTAVAFAECIVRVCGQFNEQRWRMRNRPVFTEPMEWPKAGRLTKAAPDVARTLTETVAVIRKYVEANDPSAAATA